MKATVEGFPQDKLIEAGLNANDAIFLDWFTYWWSSNTMSYRMCKGVAFAWLDREYVMKQLPIIGYRRPDDVSRHLSRLVKLGMMERKTLAMGKGKGSRSHYRPTPKVYQLKYNANPTLMDSPESAHVKTGDAIDVQNPVSLNGYRRAKSGAPDTTIKRDTTTNNIAGASRTAEENTGNSEPKRPAPMKDELAAQYEAAFTHITPMESWASIPKERKHLNDLAKRTRRLQTVTAYESEGELANDLMKTFHQMIEQGRTQYWAGCPFVPSALSARWDAVVDRVRDTVDERAQAVYNPY